MHGVLARAWGELIEALYSDDRRRQMWARDKICRPGWRAIIRLRRRQGAARAEAGFAGGKTANFIFRWADPGEG